MALLLLHNQLIIYFFNGPATDLILNMENQARHGLWALKGRERKGVLSHPPFRLPRGYEVAATSFNPCSLKSDQCLSAYLTYK